MNIFYTDRNAKKCARNHCKVHANKMITEYSQILSTNTRYFKSLETRTGYIKRRVAIDESLGRAKALRLLKRTIMYVPEFDTIEYHHGIPILVNSTIFQATHINHPCTVWARESQANYNWLLQLLCELHILYLQNKDVFHGSHRVLFTIYDSPPTIPTGIAFRKPPRCMPVEFWKDTVEESYKVFLQYKYDDWQSRPRRIKVEFYE